MCHYSHLLQCIALHTTPFPIATSMATAPQVCLPPLTSTSHPPPLFDGATRLCICYICPFAQRPWITRNYKALEDKIKLVPIDLQNSPAWYKEKGYPQNKDPAKKEFGEQLISHVDTFTRGMYSYLKGDRIRQAGPSFDYLENALTKFDDGPFFLGQFSWVGIAYITFVERIAHWIEEVNKIDAHTKTRADPKEIVALYKRRFPA